MSQGKSSSTFPIKIRMQFIGKWEYKLPISLKHSSFGAIICHKVHLMRELIEVLIVSILNLSDCLMI